METKATSLLTVVSIGVTAVVALYLFIGPGYAIELAVVSLLALSGWLRFSFREAPSQDSLVAPYILIIVFTLVLNTSRYWSNYASFLTMHWPAYFTPGFTLTHIAWFILFVTVPVSFLLLGGYYLSKRMPIGSYMAWWAFLYGIAESLIQYKVEFALAGDYNHRYFSGTFAALALLIASLVVCQRLFRQKTDLNPPPIQPAVLTDRHVNLWTTLFACFAAVYALSLYAEAGLIPVGVVVGSMIGGMIGWRKTTARYPADPYKLVPLYLLLLCLFCIHIGEEAVTKFNQAIASISGKPWSDAEFTFLIALIGPAAWIFGAWSLWRRQPFGNYILWFMIVGMILGEPAHFLIFPVVAMYKFGVGYQYFSGMYTALFPMVPAILALTVIIQDSQQRVAAQKGWQNHEESLAFDVHMSGH